MVEVKELGHIVLYVKDLDASRASIATFLDGKRSCMDGESRHIHPAALIMNFC